MKHLLGLLFAAVLLTACHTTPVATPLVVLKQVQPEFPAPALDRGESGTAVVRGWVDENGQTVHVEIQQSSGSPRLDYAALKAARRTQFMPATRAGKPVKASFRRSYTFRSPPAETGSPIAPNEKLPQPR